MDMLGSEYSSGCESGWTLYLEQSFLSPNIRQRGNQFVGAKSGCFLNKGKRNVAQEETHVCGVEEDNEEEDQEFGGDEEDLSMVSDASSGPAQFQEDNNIEGYLSYDNRHLYPPPLRSGTFVSGSVSGGKRNKVGKEKRHGKDLQDLASLLDDTASSPAFNFSKSKNQTSMESDLEYSQGFSATYFEGRYAYWENFGYVQPSYSGNNQLQNNQSRTL